MQPSLKLRARPLMEPTTNEESAAVVVLGMRWRTVLRSSFFVGILLTRISKKRRATAGLLPLPTKLCSSSAGSNDLLPNPSHPNVESQDCYTTTNEIRVVVSCLPCPSAPPSPAELTRSYSSSAAAARGAPAQLELTAPLLGRCLYPSRSFPLRYNRAPPPQPTPSKEHKECVDHYIVEVTEEDGGEEEIKEDAHHEHELADIRMMVKKRNLSFLRRFGGVQSVASALNSDLDTGISSLDQVSEPNGPTPVFYTKKNSYWHFLWEACARWIILLLAFAAVLSFVTGKEPYNLAVSMMLFESVVMLALSQTETKASGFENGFYDGAAIVAAILILTAGPSIVNFRRAKELEKVQLRTANLSVKVTRSGEDRFVEISGVVEGDVVRLEGGSIIPADGLFIDGSEMVLDEPLNPTISRDHNPFLFLGSRVVSGTGTMLVTSTVNSDALLVKELSQLDPTRTSSFLEDRINKPHNHMEILFLIVSLVILFRALVRVWHRPGIHGGIPDLKGEVGVKQVVGLIRKIFLAPRGTIPVLASVISVIAIGFQHGVPLTIGLIVSYWCPKDLSAEVPNQWACMTMGAVTDLYINTTCGLICDRMSVIEVWIGGGKIECGNEDAEISDSVLESLHQAIDVSARVPEISAAPRNSMLIEWANLMWRLAAKFEGNEYKVINYKKLRSDKKGRGTLMRKDKDDVFYVHWKGDASSILQMCSGYISRTGARCSIEEWKDDFERTIKKMEENGLVTIAFASRETAVEEITEDGLNLLAIVGLRFVCSNETKLAVRDLVQAGIRVVLVAEDEPSTLRSMARELEAADDIIVMEGLKPEDIHSEVSRCKRVGGVVAFYGGLTSDIPAMREADVGIADGHKSTQTAKDSADIVLLDNGLASLVHLLAFGRHMYRDIQVFSCLQLSTWISWLALVLVATIYSGDSPTTPLQQIWVTLITCVLGGLMMGWMDPPGLSRLIAEKPARRNNPLITKDMWIDIMTRGVSCQLLVFLLFQLKGQAILGVTNSEQTAMMFTSFALCQVMNQVRAAKTGTMKELATVLVEHYWFSLALVAAAAAQVIVVQFAHSLAHGSALSRVQWILSCGIAALPLILHRAGAVVLSAMSSGSLLGLSEWRILVSVIPFSFILLVSASQIIQPAGFGTSR